MEELGCLGAVHTVERGPQRGPDRDAEGKLTEDADGRPPAGLNRCPLRVAQRLRRVDNRRVDVLRSLFGARRADPGDIEARCLLAFSLLIGNYFVTAGHCPSAAARTSLN